MNNSKLPVQEKCALHCKTQTAFMNSIFTVYQADQGYKNMGYLEKFTKIIGGIGTTIINQCWNRFFNREEFRRYIQAQFLIYYVRTRPNLQRGNFSSTPM